MIKPATAGSRLVDPAVTAAIAPSQIVDAQFMILRPQVV
jgi:hypothetical protein